MARNFRQTVTRYMDATSPVSGVPISMFAMVKPGASVINEHTIMSLEDSVTNPDSHRLVVTGGTYGLGAGFGMRSVSGGTDKIAHYGMALSTTTWYSVLGAVYSDGTRAIFVNGTNTATQGTNIQPGVGQFSIGRAFAGATAENYLEAQLSHMAVWNYGFDATEAAAYFRAEPIVDPLWIHPQNIVWYYRCTRDGTAASATGRDWVGGTAVTPTGDPAYTDDPRVIGLPGG